MASHGMPRLAAQQEKSLAAKERERMDIRKYRELVDVVNAKVSKRERKKYDVESLMIVWVAEREFTPELLQKTADLLKRNPEYYTVWNHRRRIYSHEFEDLSESVAADNITEENRCSQVLDIIQLDLQFLFPLLIRFPKCYWIWNHRLWLLEQASLLLPVTTARPIWEDELGLVGKMLSRDSRNFLGWGYRRTIIQGLESERLKGSTMARAEFDYTTKMIGANLSNFSAWHNRSKLILRILNEESATNEERRRMLDDELKLIHKALFDPYDQSLWFYHQNLMCTFDPQMAKETMAPNLTQEARSIYLSEERDFIQEMLEDASDCKWVYQALIECSLLEARVNGQPLGKNSATIKEWLAELKKLDPLRIGRWNDLEKSLDP